MTGRLITSYFGREHIFGGDDLIVAALERVIRERLTRGETMFLSATGAEVSEREHITVILTPQTWVQFSYTDLGGRDPNLDPQVKATVATMRRHVNKHGGVCLDANDLPVEPV